LSCRRAAPTRSLLSAKARRPSRRGHLRRSRRTDREAASAANGPQGPRTGCPEGHRHRPLSRGVVRRRPLPLRRVIVPNRPAPSLRRARARSRRGLGDERFRASLRCIRAPRNPSAASSPRRRSPVLRADPCCCPTTPKSAGAWHLSRLDPDIPLSHAPPRLAADGLVRTGAWRFWSSTKVRRPPQTPGHGKHDSYRPSLGFPPLRRSKTGAATCAGLASPGYVRLQVFSTS
jgi:hypothetical protein